MKFSEAYTIWGSLAAQGARGAGYVGTLRCSGALWQLESVGTALGTSKGCTIRKRCSIRDSLQPDAPAAPMGASYVLQATAEGRPLSWPSPTEQVQGTLNITSGNMVMIAQCRFSHSREHLRMTLGAQPDARAGAFFPRRRQLTTDDATGMAFPKHLTEIDSYQAVPPQGQSGTATRYVLVPSRGASVCAKPHHIHEIPGFLKPLFSAGTQI